MHLASAAQSYYDESYPDYVAQNPERKLAFYLDAIVRSAGASRSIFEIGFGKGLFAEYASRHGFTVRGCEINPEGVEATRQLLPDGDFRLGDFEHAGCDRCEIVAAFDVVEHVPDAVGLFRTVYDRLEPGGVFCFVCPVTDGPLGLVVRALDKDPEHLHMTSRRRWLAVARDTGFVVAEWTGVLRYLLPGKRYLHLEMSGWLRRLSPAILVVCCKPQRRTSSISSMPT